MNIRDIIEKQLRERDDQEALIASRLKGSDAPQFSRDVNMLAAKLDPINTISNMYDAASFVTSPISEYFTGQGNQGTRSEEMQAALRGKPINLDPSLASMRLGAEGLNPADYGLPAVPNSVPNSVPNEAVIEEAGPSVDQMTGRSLLLRALKGSRTPIDMQRFEQLAQDRNRSGDLSTLTALYANEAGPRYSQFKDSYLKKASAEQAEKQLGDYGIASGGQFYETPGIQQGRETKADIAGAELLFDSEENDAKTLNKTLTANQYRKLMAEADTDKIALNQLDRVLATFETQEGGTDRGVSVWADQVSANFKTFFGVPANKEQYRLASRKANLQQIIGLFRTEIVGPGVVTEYDAQRILDSVGGDVGALQNPDVVKEQLANLRQQKEISLRTKERQLEYFGDRGFIGLYDPSGSYPGSAGAQTTSSPSSISSGAGEKIYESPF